jgi:hypothetical protein
MAVRPFAERRALWRCWIGGSLLRISLKPLGKPALFLGALFR